MPSRIAFALAGLGGFNAHGAGFLTAASEKGVVPDLITATSGQIVVLADWLRGKDLAAALAEPALSHNPAAQLSVALAGIPGIFRPAWAETLRRWFTPPQRSETPIDALFDRLLPAQLYVPTRGPAEFATIAAALGGESRIGVVFNAYDLNAGRDVLFGNDAARTLWPKTKAIPRRDLDPHEPELRPITPEAVESALWLSLYGFDNLPERHLIDGAYFRSCIVAELHEFDRIFVARPLAQGWRGKGPRNWFEVQDWQTEMWFSVGYKAEVETLRQINALVAAGKLGPPFREVDLIEIAPETPAGFFNYFVERRRVFDRAREKALAAFAALG